MAMRRFATSSRLSRILTGSHHHRLTASRSSPAFALLIRDLERGRSSTRAFATTDNHNNSDKPPTNEEEPPNPLADPRLHLKQIAEDLRELGLRGRPVAAFGEDPTTPASETRTAIEVEEKETPVPMFTARTLPDKMTLLVMAVSGDGTALEVSMPTLVPPRTYVYSDRMKAWVCSQDGHDMLGMITREMMPRVSGLPAWAFR